MQGFVFSPIWHITDFNAPQVFNPADTLNTRHDQPQRVAVFRPEHFAVLPVGRCLSRIEGDATSWELEPLTGLARDGQLMAFNHDGFWQPMDTLREKNLLEELWQTGRAPWKCW